MTYSKIHQAFSELLEQPDAITNPEKYLGPNWEDVLNFWIYLDTLSDEERGEMKDLYWDLDDNVRESAFVAAWCAAYDVTGCGLVFAYATLELITHHKLIEQYKTPTFLPIVVK
jgi:hypothetical protein